MRSITMLLFGFTKHNTESYQLSLWQFFKQNRWGNIVRGFIAAGLIALLAAILLQHALISIATPIVVAITLAATGVFLWLHNLAHHKLRIRNDLKFANADEIHTPKYLAKFFKQFGFLEGDIKAICDTRNPSDDKRFLLARELLLTVDMSGFTQNDIQRFGSFFSQGQPNYGTLSFIHSKGSSKVIKPENFLYWLPMNNVKHLCVDNLTLQHEETHHGSINGIFAALRFLLKTHYNITALTINDRVTIAFEHNELNISGHEHLIKELRAHIDILSELILDNYQLQIESANLSELCARMHSIEEEFNPEIATHIDRGLKTNFVAKDSPITVLIEQLCQAENAREGLSDEDIRLLESNGWLAQQRAPLPTFEASKDRGADSSSSKSEESLAQEPEKKPSQSTMFLLGLS